PLGSVSVVMIASAASSQSLDPRPDTAAPIPGSSRSIGRCSRITPVENGRTCSAVQPTSLATSSQLRRAFAIPCSPVPAFAQPVLTTSARTEPPLPARCSRQTRTGAAQKRLVVNTPAAAAPSGSRSTSTSRRFAFRMPACAVPIATPATGNNASRAGASRFTGIWASVPPDSRQPAVALLVFLARSAGAGIVAADLLAAAPDRLLSRLFGLRGVLYGQRDRLGIRALCSRRRLGEVGVHVVDVRIVRLHRFLDLFDLVGRLDPHRHQDPRDVRTNALLHQAEDLEGFALVFLLRILLGIAAQVDALAQVVERSEVLAPVLID